MIFAVFLVDPTGEGHKAAEPDHVYMDAMGFGMGLCCLQLTFQVDICFHSTECPKIYRKYELHLLKYTAYLY